MCHAMTPPRRFRSIGTVQPPFQRPWSFQGSEEGDQDACVLRATHVTRYRVCVTRLFRVPATSALNSATSQTESHHSACKRAVHAIKTMSATSYTFSRVLRHPSETLRSREFGEGWVGCCSAGGLGDFCRDVALADADSPFPVLRLHLTPPPVALQLAAFSTDRLHPLPAPQTLFCQSYHHHSLLLVSLSPPRKDSLPPVSPLTQYSARCSARYFGSGENGWLPGALQHNQPSLVDILHSTTSH